MKEALGLIDIIVTALKLSLRASFGKGTDCWSFAILFLAGEASKFFPMLGKGLILLEDLGDFSKGESNIFPRSSGKCGKSMFIRRTSRDIHAVVL